MVPTHEGPADGGAVRGVREYWKAAVDRPAGWQSDLCSDLELRAAASVVATLVGGNLTRVLRYPVFLGL